MTKRRIPSQNKPNKKIKDLESYDRFNEKLNLLKAAKEGNVKTLRNILNKRLFDYNLLNDYESNNILHITVIKEHVECIEEILKRKDFLVHESNGNKDTALDIIVKQIKSTKYHHTKLIKYTKIAYLIIKHVIDNTDDYDLEEYEKDFRTIFKELNDFIAELQSKVVNIKIDLKLYISQEELKNKLIRILSLTTIEA